MSDLPVAATREKQRFAEEGRGPLEIGFSSTVRGQRSAVGPSTRERERSGVPCLLHHSLGEPVSVPWFPSPHFAWPPQQGPLESLPRAQSLLSVLDSGDG